MIAETFPDDRDSFHTCFVISHAGIDITLLCNFSINTVRIQVFSSLIKKVSREINKIIDLKHTKG